MAVAVPEIWAAASGSDFIWPTISGTVGHLEDKWAIVAIAPVAALAAAAFALSHFETTGVTIQADAEALIRTDEGRVAKLGKVELGPDKPVPELVTNPGAALAGRTKWPVLPYFFIATVIVVIGSLAASTSNDKWATGYVLYSLIGIFGMVIPNALAYWRRKDVPFSTLFFTIRSLERRLHAVAILIGAGLAVLLIHLAVYPWPDLARDSASYAGLTASKAEDKATHALKRKYPGTALKASAKSKEIVDGSRAWFVYFRGPHGYSHCVLVVTGGSEPRVPVECST